MRFFSPFLLLLAANAAGAQPSAEATPRYFEAIQSELNAMDVTATCEVTDSNRGVCHYLHHGRRSDQDFVIKLIYDDGSDTVFMYVDRYLMAPPTDPHTPILLQRLMELNWAMLAGKYEWDRSDGEVRLSVTLHTDSNFDRRAFRNLLHSLALQADRSFHELRSILTTAPASVGEQPDEGDRAP